MSINKKRKYYIRIIYSICCFVIAAASAAALWYYNVGIGWDPGYFGTKPLILISIMYTLLYFFFARIYNALIVGNYRLTELAFSQLLSFSFSDAVYFVAAFFWFHNLQRIHLSLFLFALVLQTLSAASLAFVFNRLFAYYDEPRRVIIIYGGGNYDDLVEKMNRYRHRYQILGCFEESEDINVLKKRILDGEDIYLFNIERGLQNRLIRYCRQQDKKIHVSLDVDDLILQGYELSHFFDTPFLHNRNSSVQWYYPIVKRTGDILIALILLVITLPVLLVTVIAIKVCDRGPVLYCQNRLTKGGRIFTIYKFRSMYVDSEDSPRLAEKNDSRITPVGSIIRKFRIDELPQLLNVLKGDMSMVGPRPERPEIAEEYAKAIEDFPLRLAVPAGITGYAQVYGLYSTTPLDKLKLDLLYIADRSVLLDSKLLFHTVKIVFKPESSEGV